MNSGPVYPTTPQLKLKLLLLQIFLVILTPIWILKMVHYFFCPIPALFDSPSLIPQESTPLQKLQDFDIMRTLFNLSFFFAFFAQHIIMAHLKFKIFMQNISKNYPLYERLIYNIISSILLYLILDYQQPQHIVIFQLPLWVSLPLFFIGFGFYMDSNLQMDHSIFFPYSFSALIAEKSLEINEPNYNKVETTGINIKGSYAWIRHPMQSGLFLFLTFGSRVFTLEKIIIMTIMAIGIYIGVKMEQQRLTKRYAQYSEYKLKIKNKFIPFLF